MRSTSRSRADREKAADRHLIIGLVALLVVAATTITVAVSSANSKTSHATRSAAAVSAEMPLAKPRPMSAVTTPVAASPPAPAAKPEPKAAPATPTAPSPKKRAKTVKPAPKAAAAPAPGAKTIPEKMHSLLPGSTQLIVITGAKLGSKSGTLRVLNKDGGHWRQVFATPANFGANGLTNGETRTSGHLNTPTGIWRLEGYVFGQHAKAPAGTKMPYRRITSTSWWSAEHDSTYNTWVNSTSHMSGEHLQDARVQYEYAFDTGYNAPPNTRVIGRGTAIFIHCFEPPGNSLGPNTHGCIAISRSSIIRVFGLLDPRRRPSCAIGTLTAKTSTSIYSY
jgi:L,D-peptidoglycan transpeptidase YkuD (ErfK/YbiS/YcfS/YnhG family)